MPYQFVVLLMGADPHPNDGPGAHVAKRSVMIPHPDGVTILAAAQTVEIEKGGLGSSTTVGSS